MIIVGGENVFAMEVEQVISRQEIHLIFDFHLIHLQSSRVATAIQIFSYFLNIISIHINSYQYFINPISFFSNPLQGYLASFAVQCLILRIFNKTIWSEEIEEMDTFWNMKMWNAEVRWTWWNLGRGWDSEHWVVHPCMTVIFRTGRPLRSDVGRRWTTPSNAWWYCGR